MRLRVRATPGHDPVLRAPAARRGRRAKVVLPRPRPSPIRSTATSRAAYTTERLPRSGSPNGARGRERPTTQRVRPLDLQLPHATARAWPTPRACGRCSTWRPGFLPFSTRRGSGLRHFPADTHLTRLARGDGHRLRRRDRPRPATREGVALLAPYQGRADRHASGVPHRPHARRARSATSTRGGRLMYLGGNGFYWRVATHRSVPGVDRDAAHRRRHPHLGGRARRVLSTPSTAPMADCGGAVGRPPQTLCGIGFTSQGTFEGDHYRRRRRRATARRAGSSTA